MAELKTDFNETQKALALLKQDHGNSLVEVRLFKGKYVKSGYFKDYNNLLKSLSTLDYDNCYITLNTINDACYARTQKETMKANCKATSDHDIINRDWLLIDADPKRPSGTSSTKEEKYAAAVKLAKVMDYLSSMGFYNPIVADSGNGYHLLYKINMISNTDSEKSITPLIQYFLSALDMMFSDKEVEIDISVSNPSRMTKLYGTMAKKGSNEPDRPHRISRIIKVPDEIKANHYKMIQKIADLLPKPANADTRRYHGQYQNNFNIDDFVSQYLSVTNVIQSNNYTKYLLAECPFNHEHKSPESMITVGSNGAIGFHCFHNSCSGYKWPDVRQKFEPDAYNKQKFDDRRTTAPMMINTAKSIAEYSLAKKEGGKPELKQYLQMHEIQRRDRSKMVFMPTGTKGIDKRIVGMCKGEITVISGTNGSGKSTLVTYWILNHIQCGYKCTLYSGELDADRLQAWIHLQAAGRNHNKQSQFGEHIFYTPNDIADQINEWMKGKFFLHNNEKDYENVANMFGNGYKNVMDTIIETVEKEGSDIVYIDNLMAMDIELLDIKELEAQRKMLLYLRNLARKYKIHVVLICHPKKQNGFLRKIDVFGSGHIVNIIDNLFMMHRCNRDFVKSFTEFIDDKQFCQEFLNQDYTNVCEIMKNREFGIVDEFIGMYYEKESKRFLNELHEYQSLDWKNNHDINNTIFDLNNDKSFKQVEIKDMPESMR